MSWVGVLHVGKLNVFNMKKKRLCIINYDCGSRHFFKNFLFIFTVDKLNYSICEKLVRQLNILFLTLYKTIVIYNQWNILQTIVIYKTKTYNNFELIKNNYIEFVDDIFDIVDYEFKKLLTIMWNKYYMKVYRMNNKFNWVFNWLCKSIRVYSQQILKC